MCCREMISSHATQLPPQKVHQQVDIFLEHANHVLETMRRSILLEDIMETVKVQLEFKGKREIDAFYSSLSSSGRLHTLAHGSAA